jgi:hypothetical protein
MEQGDVCRAVGIILYGCHLGGDAIFVSAEIDYPVVAFVTAAPVPNGYATLIVAARALPERSQQGLLRLGLGDFLKGGNRSKPPAGGGRSIGFNSHDLPSLEQNYS